MGTINDRAGFDTTQQQVDQATKDVNQSGLNGQYDNAKTLQAQLGLQSQNMKLNTVLGQATALKSMADKVQL